MAIAYDTSSTNGAESTGTSISWSHTCTGSNRALVVIVEYAAYHSTATPSVTYNGVSMTEIAYSDWPGSTVASCTLFYLSNPASGTNTVTITFGSSIPGSGIALSYTGVKQTGQPEANSTQTVYPPSIGSLTQTVTTSTGNSWLVGGATSGSTGAKTAGSGTTIRNEITAAYLGGWDSGGALSPAGSYSLSITNSTAWRGIVIAIAPEPASGPTGVKTFDGVTQSTGIKTYLGVAVASVKSVNGIT